jgi:hypothetical protein
VREELLRALYSFVCLYLLVSLSACTQTPSYTQQTLPSGRIIKVGGIGTMYFTKNDPALMLKYYTDLNISDASDLREEVDDIWQSFRVNVEKEGLKSAIISANELPQGIISKTRGYNFIFVKEEDGLWKRKE